jgi:hypothetical protein
VRDASTARGLSPSFDQRAQGTGAHIGRLGTENGQRLDMMRFTFAFLVITVVASHDGERESSAMHGTNRMS